MDAPGVNQGKSSASPKVGVVIPNITEDGGSVPVEHIWEFSRRAESLGYDCLWVIDHFFKAPPVYRESRFDPLTTLASVAAKTTTIKVGTSLLILPLRNPVHVAKEAATLDNLCSGRFMFGVGVGWNPPEFEVSQVPLRQRGVRTEESMEIIRRLLSEENVSYEGRFFTLKNVTIEPRPIQKPHPPMLYGGGTLDPELYPSDHPIPPKRANKDTVLRRIARLSDGIMTQFRSFSVTSAQPAEEDWKKICEYARGYGRDPSRFMRSHLTHFYIAEAGDRRLESARRAVAKFTPEPFEHVRKMYLLGTPDDAAETLNNWVRTSGIRYFVLNPIADYLSQIEILAREVLPRVTGA